MTCHAWRFSDWVGGFVEKRHFDVLRGNFNMDAAPNLYIATF